jgi:hypothetical protein
MEDQQRNVEQPGGEAERVAREIQARPHVLMRLAENSLTVADSLRDNYLRNTATFVGHLRRAIRLADKGKRDDPPL